MMPYQEPHYTGVGGPSWDDVLNTLQGKIADAQSYLLEPYAAAPTSEHIGNISNTGDPLYDEILNNRRQREMDIMQGYAGTPRYQQWLDMYSPIAYHNESEMPLNILQTRHNIGFANPRATALRGVSRHHSSGGY